MEVVIEAFFFRTLSKPQWKYRRTEEGKRVQHLLPTVLTIEMIESSENHMSPLIEVDTVFSDSSPPISVNAY